ncbi:HAD-IIA family hydrolase [Pseudonocardia kunmingensis]|uniref:HAD superfamily hydrolase (TIGR01457 family) n=1 Tax=Pseudonocardia kunmingensis TaxID=630975 RepID=A0A543DVX1_9PSEU|nr:HAD-IIA family hydrolase [Pseudonocardia kunmingensis]TQM13463.1 HAD superfamily hydrolase (TIGR01457 family) [Pseudonocardia kunmingensis]
MTDLLARHDVLLADLDGTLYRGQAAVPGAVEAVRVAGQRGVRTVYVTNNASRRPAAVAEHLEELGFPAGTEDVVASSQAAASLLAEQLPAGARVLVVGTEALVAEVTSRGLRVVERAEDADAVVQGHNPETGWRQLAEATVAVRGGALWVACNVDTTLPTERGPLPGNGSMVEVVRLATGREPQVAGKPGPALLHEAARRSGAQRPLMVGDRLDTDIEGGRAAGMPTLLVLTGVSDAAELLAAPPALRPDYVAADLDALTAPADDLAPAPRPGWEVRAGTSGALVLSGDGTDPVDALRALCAEHWAAGGGPVQVEADGPAARDAVRRLGLGAPDGGSATVASSDPAPDTRPVPGTGDDTSHDTSHDHTAGAHR